MTENTGNQITEEEFAKQQIRENVGPLVQSVFKESISSKVVLSGLSQEVRDGLGPYWVVYACLEHVTGVKTMPLTLGRFYPDVDFESLQQLGHVIVIREKDRFTTYEAELIRSVLVDVAKEQFDETEITEDAGSYFDACCVMFPGETTTQNRKDFVAFQSRMTEANQDSGA